MQRNLDEGRTVQSLQSPNNAGGIMTAAENAPAVKLVSIASPVVVVTCVCAAMGCASLRSAAESAGLVPLDSARAVAVGGANTRRARSPRSTSYRLRGRRRP